MRIWSLRPWTPNDAFRLCFFSYKTTKLHMKVFLKRLKKVFLFLNKLYICCRSETVLFLLQWVINKGDSVSRIVCLHITIWTPRCHVSRLFSILQITSGLNESRSYFNRENTTFLYAVLIITAKFFLLECACLIDRTPWSNKHSHVRVWKETMQISLSHQSGLATTKCRLIGRYGCFYKRQCFSYQAKFSVFWWADNVLYV